MHMGHVENRENFYLGNCEDIQIRNFDGSNILTYNIQMKGHFHYSKLKEIQAYEGEYYILLDHTLYLLDKSSEKLKEFSNVPKETNIQKFYLVKSCKSNKHLDILIIDSNKFYRVSVQK